MTGWRIAVLPRARQLSDVAWAPTWPAACEAPRVGSRGAWWLLWTAGWLGVIGLGSSAATVTLGAALLTYVPVAAPMDDLEPDAPEGGVRTRVRPPITLARNPFCPTCTDAEPSTPFPSEPDDDPIFAGARPTQLPIRLHATLEASLASVSVAVIHDRERGVLGPYFVGDELRPGVRLASIGQGSILLSNHGVTEYALVDPEVRSTDAVNPSAPEEPAAADASISCSGTTCTVKREFVEALLRDPSALVGQGNVMPTTTADGRSGFRITGARKGTLPRLLGLRNGDVLVEVGGKEATLDELLGLRARFGSLDRLEIGVLRRQKLVDLTLVFEG